MRLNDAVRETDLLGNEHKELNLKYGSQQGYMPVLGARMPDGKTYGEWINNAAYLSRNLIPYVLEVPKFFEFFDNPQDWTETFISIFEVHPEVIDGLDATLTVEKDQHNIGGGGQVQHEITNVKRPEAAVKYTLREKDGKPINRFLDMYIRYGIMDPDVKKPLVTLLPKFKRGILYTPDYYTFSTLFVEPDITQTRVVEAYLVINQSPNTAGTVTSKRDLSTGAEMVTYDIETGGILVYTQAVRELGQLMLDRTSALSINPDKVVAPVDQTNLQAAVQDSKFNFNEDAERARI